MTASIPIYRYTITRKDDNQRVPLAAGGELIASPIQVDAMSFREEDPWLIFDDTEATVLTIRIDTVDMIQRSARPVGDQTVDDLTDPINPQDLT